MMFFFFCFFFFFFNLMFFFFLFFFLCTKLKTFILSHLPLQHCFPFVMFRLLRCAVALTAFQVVKSAKYNGQCSYRLGIDFYGNDIGSVRANSGDACIVPCLEHPRCSHFTFMYGQCFLKSSGDGMQKSDGAISGVCEKSNYISIPTLGSKMFRCDLIGQKEYQSANLAAYSATSYNDCIQGCLDQPGCASFTYAWSKCYLKEASTDSVVFNKKAESGSCRFVDAGEGGEGEGKGERTDSNGVQS